MPWFATCIGPTGFPASKKQCCTHCATSPHTLPVKPAILAVSSSSHLLQWDQKGSLQKVPVPHCLYYVAMHYGYQQHLPVCCFCPAVGQGGSPAGGGSAACIVLVTSHCAFKPAFLLCVHPCSGKEGFLQEVAAPHALRYITLQCHPAVCQVSLPFLPVCSPAVGQGWFPARGGSASHTAPRGAQPGA
jgi:hypothetical protein